ncbi:lipid II:glycine glycyltransferase FemX [Halegenticoccus tardaugens]|uniref:lipid II:glycine glycyltransferase FemX n=1 Tax=Halegenticoccus tardaugens TaxID=2071624 RepID=UPI00100B6B2C|nr:GNAT family N-acetyltransferase [Halegenticoccus tardaugens]
MAQKERLSHETVERHGIRVGPATDEQLESWDKNVERSPHGTVYHQLEALRVQADHSGTMLHPLVGFKGQESVGIFPLFTRSKARVNAAFSPPPNLWVSYLGPALLNFEGLKQRRQEKRHRRFIGAALEWLDDAYDPAYTNVRSACTYTDPRPFKWNGFELTPRYTYHVDLTPTREELLASFSSDARRNIRTDEDRYEIEEVGPRGIERIIAQVRNRHEEQGESYSVTPAFVVDLYERLPDGQVRPYVCRVDGEFVGGMVTLAYGDTVHRWQGGAKTDSDVPVNDLIDWRIMTDAMDAGYDCYNLVGANNERLCSYKAKFSPTVAQYYSLGRRSVGMRMVAEVYKRFLR